MTEETKEITVAETPVASSVSAFSSINAFEQGQRMASLLSKSDLVPQSYKGNVANCLLALEVANRTGSSIMAVVQNLIIVHGRPSWLSSYIIAAINGCGRFTPLNFKIWVDGNDKHCLAYTHSRATGELVEGPPVSTAMAKAEGWTDRNGSKWKTMPDLMLRYRSAAFFGRLYAPDVLMGMHTADEIEDISAPAPTTGKTSALNDRIRAKVVEGEVVTPEPKKEGPPITKTSSASKTKAQAPNTVASAESSQVELPKNQSPTEGFY